MKTVQKTSFICILFFIFIYGSAVAGIEPFYKGDWGIGANEVIALYDREPPAVELGQMLVYANDDAGVYTETTYFFSDNALTGVSYLVKGNFTKEQELRKQLKQLDSLMKDPNGTAFKREVKEKKLANGLLVFLYLWKNDRTQVLGQVYVNTKDKTYNLTFSFTDILNPDINVEQSTIINSLNDIAQEIYDSFSK